MPRARHTIREDHLQKEIDRPPPASRQGKRLQGGEIAWRKIMRSGEREQGERLKRPLDTEGILRAESLNTDEPGILGGLGTIPFSGRVIIEDVASVGEE